MILIPSSGHSCFFVPGVLRARGHKAFTGKNRYTKTGSSIMLKVTENVNNLRNF